MPQPGQKSRRPAQPPRNPKKGPTRGWFLPILVTVGLVALPAFALSRLQFPFLWAAGYVVAINLITGLLYRHDKRCAQNGAWRVPENILHLLELAGGWPGAFLAQRWFRHKCSKGSYQFVFWLIVAAWQYAAFDSLQNWKFSKALASALQK